jgi:long-chain fatty acid transport protein
VVYPETTQFPILGDRAQSITVRGAVGADVGWGIKVGVGFAALAEIVGSVVAATDATGRVGTRVDNQLVATYAPNVGVAYDLPLFTKLRVGLAFRGVLDARFEVVVDGTKLSTLAIPLFNISGLAQYDPAQVALEVARIDSLNVLALQLVYKKWSDFPGVLEPTVVCSEGGRGACGLVPPVVPWSDTLVVRIGAEQGYVLLRSLVMRTRGGGFFEKSPLPSDIPGSEAFEVSSRTVIPVPTRYFDADRVALTLGTGVSLAKPLPPVDLDLFGQFHLLLPRSVKSTDGNGRTLSEGEASGRVTVFGMTAGVRF